MARLICEVCGTYQGTPHRNDCPLKGKRAKKKTASFRAAISLPKYEVRKCLTLGTNFRDIYKDGELFAMQVGKDVAEWLMKHPEIFMGSVGAPVEMMRTWALENDYRNWQSIYGAS